MSPRVEKNLQVARDGVGPASAGRDHRARTERKPRLGDLKALGAAARNESFPVPHPDESSIWRREDTPSSHLSVLDAYLSGEHSSLMGAPSRHRAAVQFGRLG